jgi:hypothetical protein
MTAFCANGVVDLELVPPDTDVVDVVDVVLIIIMLFLMVKN